MRRNRLIARAERYQQMGRSLPADLYTDLMAEGIDASSYNEPIDN